MAAPGTILGAVTWHALSRGWAYLYPLQHTAGWSITEDMDADIQSSARVTVQTGREEPDWGSLYLRAYWDDHLTGHSHLLGTWEPELPGADWGSKSRVRELSLLDMTAPLRKSAWPHIAFFPADWSIRLAIQTVVDALHPNARMALELPESARTVRGMGWDPGTPAIDIINDLLAVAGHRPLHTTGMGALTSTWLPGWDGQFFHHQYLPGPDATHMADVQESNRSNERHNYVLVMGRKGEGAPEGDPDPWQVAENADPADLMSTVRRGRRMLPPVTLDTDDAATLRAHAQHLLWSEAGSRREWTYRHIWDPYGPGHAVRLVTSLGLDAHGYVVRRKWSNGGLVESTLRDWGW